MFRRALLVVVAGLLLAVSASDVEACWRLLACRSNCGSECQTILRFELRIKKLELAIMNGSQSQAVTTLRCEVEELRSEFQKLRDRAQSPDLFAELKDLSGKVTNLEQRPAIPDSSDDVRKLYDRMKAVEDRVGKLAPRVTSLETTATEQAKLITALQNQLADLTKVVDLHLHPPVPENPIMTWEQLLAAFPQLAQLHEDVQRVYWRYEPGRILAHPVVSRLQMEALKAEVAVGKKLLLVDTGVCIPQHLLGVLPHVTLRGSVAADDVESGHGVLLVAVGKTMSIREFCLAVVLGWRLQEGKVETKEGLVVELDCGTVIVHHRRN
ncbi:MAG: hypothetical protein WCG83_02755 [Candidatus Peregrinibacteria bacterium]